MLDFVQTNWPQVTLKHQKFSGDLQNVKMRLFGNDDQTKWDARSIFKPRLMLTGQGQNGQNLLAAALLDSMDHIKIIKITLGSLYSNQTRTVEDALGEYIREASRAGKAILYIPGKNL